MYSISIKASEIKVCMAYFFVQIRVRMNSGQSREEQGKFSPQLHIDIKLESSFQQFTFSEKKKQEHSKGERKVGHVEKSGWFLS